MIKCQPQYEVYAWLSKMVTGQGNYIAESGELLQKYIGEHLKYHLDEHESFREIFSIREQFKNNYVKLERYVVEKKEKLWKQGDLYKWGGFTDNIHLEKMRDELKTNKEKAFMYMLPKETKDLEARREELGFYSN